MIAIILIYSFLISGIFAGLDDFCQSSTASTSGQSRPPSPPDDRCFVDYLRVQGPCQPGELESYDEAVLIIKKSNTKLLGLIKKTRRGISLVKLDAVQLGHEPDEQLANLGYTRESAQRMLINKLRSANFLLKLLDKIYKDQMSSMMKIQTELFTRQCPGIREILLKTSDHFKDPKMVPFRLSEIFGDPQGKYVSMFPKMARTVGISRPDEATQTTEPDQSTETDMQVD
ncbi:hypothetical protein RTP6_006820 [Batrachochytrium dendrobatidis]